MVVASRSRKKQAQSKKEAVIQDAEEAMPQAAEPATERNEKAEEPSASRPVRIYADGGSQFGRCSTLPTVLSRRHKPCFSRIRFHRAFCHTVW